MLLPAMLTSNASNAASASRDLEIARTRFIAALLERPPSDAVARRLLDAIREDGSWPGIDYDDVSRTGWTHGRHMSNTRNLALAFKHPDSAHYQDRRVRSAVLAALDFWFERDFASARAFGRMADIR